MNFSWYGLLIGLAFLMFWHLFESVLLSKKKVAANHINSAIIFTGLGALLGARIYHLTTDWPLYQAAPWWKLFAVWQGGLGIFGALLGGGLGLFLWKKTSRFPLSWSEISDAAALSLPAAQALGRWGNFFNQELFGQPSTLPWAIYIRPENRPEIWKQFSTFHPLFFYESFFSFTLLAFLWFIKKRHSNIFPIGSRFFTSYYFIGYGSVRFSLELLRYPTPLVFGLTSGQWSSLFLIVIGLLAFPRYFPLQWSKHVEKNVSRHL